VSRSTSMTILHADCRDAMAEMAPDSVDSIVTDPPYGLSFMGKEWDHGVPGAEFWTAALRVAKPGAHLLAFGGTRTFHRLAVAIEDAGWEIRDTVMWVYGSGFPKSLDVSKAIDKMDAKGEQEARRLRFTAWVRSTGITAGQINEATGTFMGSHYTTAASQPAVMTREHLEAVRHMVGDVPEWVEREADIRTVESQNFASREVVEERTAVQGGGSSLQIRMGERREVEANITAPATDAARQWDGWGTALKPAWEPIIVARKPLVGTVAANVLEYGTGGLNVDGCRVGTGDGYTENAVTERRTFEPAPGGRWPANLIHDGSDEVVGLFPEAGSAARFFYCAKASKRDREEGLEAFDAVSRPNGNKWTDQDYRVTKGERPASAESGPRKNLHPTVKPTDLMRYLCRLVTPPGGLVLDPFCGSGSTGKAALLEGFRFIGVEKDEASAETARARCAAVGKQGIQGSLPLEAA
jgi:DNA modification methylase